MVVGGKEGHALTTGTGIHGVSDPDRSIEVDVQYHKAVTLAVKIPYLLTQFRLYFGIWRFVFVLADEV